MKTKNIFFMVLSALILVSLAASETRSEIRIDSITWDPAHVEAGDEVTIYAKFVLRPISVTWRIQNPDNVAVRQDPSVFYKARLEAADDLSKQNIVIKGGTKNVGHLFVGESWTTPFSIKVKNIAEAASYKMRFSVIKTDINGTYEEVSKIMEFELPVKGSVKFDVDSDNVVKLGCISDIKVVIRNRGNGYARHVVAKVDLSSPFTPAKTSEVYLGDFSPGEEKNATFKVSVDSETEKLVYNIPLTLTYVGDKGTEETENRNIGVRIDETPEIKVSLVASDKMTVGAKGKVTVAVVNRGFVDAKFLNLRLQPSEKYKIISQDEYYIGNLDSDDSDEKEFEIKLSSDLENGKIPLKFLLTYKSANRNIDITQEDTVDLRVLSAEELAAEQPKQDILGTLVGVIVFIPVLVVVYLVIWLVYKSVSLLTSYLNKRFFTRR